MKAEYATGLIRAWCKGDDEHFRSLAMQVVSQVHEREKWQLLQAIERRGQAPALQLLPKEFTALVVPLHPPLLREGLLSELVLQCTCAPCGICMHHVDECDCFETGRR